VVSRLVDEIGDVVSVAETTFVKPPNTLDGVTKNLIRGAYKLGNRLLLNLDTEKTIKLYDQDVSSAWQ
jgi:purine-binding chemotaxis protein CheW